MKVVALAGGTGSAKLLRGLSRSGAELTVVANVGDNYLANGLYVCPDVDTAVYTLAGVASRERGWGVEGDTFEALGQLRRLGEPAWFSLGDRDIALHLARARMLREGKSLTEATDALRRALGSPWPVLPATDARVETHVLTPEGALHLQEFWVRDRGRPAVKGVEYRGASGAAPTKEVRRALSRADRIVVCPANPVTSIGPMLAVPGFTEMLAASRATAVGVSPMVGKAPVSGPAAKLMRGTGVRPDTVGVARAYSGFLDALLVDRGDAGSAGEIRALGVRCVPADIVMKGRAGEARLAREVLTA